MTRVNWVSEPKGTTLRRVSRWIAGLCAHNSLVIISVMSAIFMSLTQESNCTLLLILTRLFIPVRFGWQVFVVWSHIQLWISFGDNGLSCRSSESRHHRHAALNDIVHRTLNSAKIPERLEPSGLQRSGGKRPDGITMVPWKCGKLLPGQLCPIIHPKCYLGGRACCLGAEERKEAKYTSLGSLHCFTPLAIETTGVLGPKSITFVKELGGRVACVTGDQKSYYLGVIRITFVTNYMRSVRVLAIYNSGLELCSRRISCFHAFWCFPRPILAIFHIAHCKCFSDDYCVSSSF